MYNIIKLVKNRFHVNENARKFQKKKFFSRTTYVTIVGVKDLIHHWKELDAIDTKQKQLT